MLCLLMMSVTGEVYVEYKMGPSTEPRGTPQKRFRLDERELSPDLHETGSSRIDVTVSNLRLSQLFQNDVLA